MDIDPRERLVDVYSEMRTLDAEHFEFLSSALEDEHLMTWALATIDSNFQALIQEAQQLKDQLGLK